MTDARCVMAVKRKPLLAVAEEEYRQVLTKE